MEWSEGCSAIAIVFGLERRRHLFRAEPIAWAKFTEPQFTKGFAYFLNEAQPHIRIQRARALLKALGAAALRKDMSGVRVVPEAPTLPNKRYSERIDLLITWKDSPEGETYTAAIEAKINHPVTKHQLSTYRKHLIRRSEVTKERLLLVVVSPRLVGRTREALRMNSNWRWIAWRDLIVAHERALPDDCDNDAYLQFRRTLWDQAG